MPEPVIICVDDERVVLRSLKRELTNTLGDTYLIETTESAEETLDLLQKLLADHYEIPVIIADYIMPGMKGDELLKRIHAITPKTLKILLTGQANMEAVINAVNFAELYRYIAKPWEKTDLALTVREAIRRYFQEKQIAEQNLILQNMNKILEQQVQERTAELEAKKQELEHANISKDKFFSIIAHDLRAPFTGLLGFTQIFLESFEEFSSQEIKESLSSLQKTAKTVYTLVDNLLTWSRLQRGMMEYFPQEVFLEKVAEHNINLLVSTAEQKQIALKSLITDPITVYADLNMLNTVFRNLISNALKFTSTGGSVSVSARQNEAHVEVAVVDTGTGIKPEDLTKLFRIDVKLTGLGTAGERGSGLGLILCKELVEKNGGQIWVESEVGKGTTFRFTIPKSPV
jgi:two-component system sensor histidine kinase/response regulator